MARRTTYRVWTVVYPDPLEHTGFGVAHFDNAAEAQDFGVVHRAIRILDEVVPARIANRWTFTRWGRP